MRRFVDFVQSTLHPWRVLERTFYHRLSMQQQKTEQLFEVARRTFDTPEFRGITFIEAEAKTIINHVPGNSMPFSWTINPYRGCSHACVYCFARVTHTYMDMNAGHDFESKIVVKINAPEVLRAQLRSRRWHGGHIAMGTATDPYQRAEGRYGLMRGIIRALIDYRNPFSILTKGTLILRDHDLLTEAAKVTDVSTAFSIGTLDEEAWRASEPSTPHPRARMDAVAALNDAGIPCGVMLAPILPGITDDPFKMRKVIDAAVAAGATHISPILLHLRPVVREEYMGWLHESYPGLVKRYEQMYARSPYGQKEERNALATTVHRLITAAGGLKRRPHVSKRLARARPEETRRPGPKQLKLI